MRKLKHIVVAKLLLTLIVLAPDAAASSNGATIAVVQNQAETQIFSKCVDSTWIAELSLSSQSGEGKGKDSLGMPALVTDQHCLKGKCPELIGKTPDTTDFEGRKFKLSGDDAISGWTLYLLRFPKTHFSVYTPIKIERGRFDACNATPQAELALSSAHETIINSEIRIAQSEYKWKYGAYAQTCRGSLTQKLQAALKSVGVTKNEFSKGVGCVAGDFDNNRFLDYAFFNAESGNNHKIVVLFFDKSGLAFSNEFKGNGYYFYSCADCYGTKGGALIMTGSGHEDIKAVFSKKSMEWQFDNFSNP